MSVYIFMFPLRIVLLSFIRPKEFVGLYVHQNNIIVDIFNDTENKVRAYVHNDCSSIFKENQLNPEAVVIFNEQKTKPSYTVRRGSAVLKSTNDIIIGESKDTLKRLQIPFGSVACIATDTNDQSYIITARHIFEDDPDTVGDLANRMNATFITENDADLEHVSNECFGVFGVHEPNGSGVDISLIPIQIINDAQNVTIDPPKLYDGSVENLDFVQVEKQGASLESVKGIILKRKIRYRPNIGGGPCGDCLFITAKNADDMFVGPGDSGSLVIARNESGSIAIGTVCKSHEGWLHITQNESQFVCVVLLKNCLAAIKHHFNIEIKSLQGNWERCNVLAIP